MTPEIIAAFIFGVYSERMSMISRWVNNVPNPEGEEELKIVFKVLMAIEDFAYNCYALDFE